MVPRRGGGSRHQSPKCSESNNIPLFDIFEEDFCSRVCYFIPHMQFEVIPDTLCAARVTYCHGVTNTHRKLAKALKSAGHTEGDCHHLVEAEILPECFWTVRFAGGWWVGGRGPAFVIPSHLHRSEAHVYLQSVSFKPISLNKPKTKKRDVLLQDLSLRLFQRGP